MQLTLNMPNPLSARQALFLSIDGQPFTTSRAVAERFGKRHTEVLRSVQKHLTESPDPKFSQRNFASAEYLDKQGKPRLEYRLSHDAFALLAMSFTGSEALAWKIAFLQAFNALEADLQARATRFALALDQVRPTLRPVVEGTEVGLSRTAIASPLGKSASSISCHRRTARRLGLLPAKPLSVEEASEISRHLRTFGPHSPVTHQLAIDGFPATQSLAGQTPTGPSHQPGQTGPAHGQHPSVAQERHTPSASLQPIPGFQE
ncbi:MAG TPA: Rha family transcriptional regulator [Pseudomonas sp.]|uniref:Rha family transcriptional regulator n=1 Tax=Pseudomonas sp. TaxID=306 RepID=UPI002ED78590